MGRSAVEVLEAVRMRSPCALAMAGSKNGREWTGDVEPRANGERVVVAPDVSVELVACGLPAWLSSDVVVRVRDEPVVVVWGGFRSSSGAASQESTPLDADVVRPATPNAPHVVVLTDAALQPPIDVAAAESALVEIFQASSPKASEQTRPVLAIRVPAQPLPHALLVVRQLCSLVPGRDASVESLPPEWLAALSAIERDTRPTTANAMSVEHQLRSRRRKEASAKAEESRAPRIVFVAEDETRLLENVAVHSESVEEVWRRATSSAPPTSSQESEVDAADATAEKKRMPTNADLTNSRVWLLPRVDKKKTMKLPVGASRERLQLDTTSVLEGNAVVDAARAACGADADAKLREGLRLVWPGGTLFLRGMRTFRVQVPDPDKARHVAGQVLRLAAELRRGAGGGGDDQRSVT